MTYQEAMVEAQSRAHIKTEEDCHDFGVVVNIYKDGRELYTDEARKIYNTHFDIELKKLMEEYKIKEVTI